MLVVSIFSAFDLAVALMELDEVCELVTDSKYAYGKAGKYVFLQIQSYSLFHVICVSSILVLRTVHTNTKVLLCGL